jgi:hypothetical protein
MPLFPSLFNHTVLHHQDAPCRHLVGHNQDKVRSYDTKQEIHFRNIMARARSVCSRNDVPVRILADD